MRQIAATATELVYKIEQACESLCNLAIKDKSRACVKKLQELASYLHSESDEQRTALLLHKWIGQTHAELTGKLERITRHLRKSIDKYLADSNDFRRDYNFDLAPPRFGKNIRMVVSIVLSQILRQGIDEMDDSGYVEYRYLQQVWFDYLERARNDLERQYTDQQQPFAEFFAPFAELRQDSTATQALFDLVIFEEQPVGSYSNCGRGGRYGTRQDAGKFYIRASYGHTIDSGLNVAKVAGPDTTLTDHERLVHATTWANFEQIQEINYGVYSMQRYAVQMEKMPADLAYFQDYTRNRKDDEASGGRKDPIQVASRHLPQPQGIIVLLETRTIAELKKMEVEIYNANRPAEMYQVLYNWYHNIDEQLGFLGIPINGFERYHLYWVDKTTHHRRHLGTANDYHQAQAIYAAATTEMGR